MTQEQIKHHFNYNPKTGIFKKKTGLKTGQVAGHAHSGGYLQVSLYGKHFYLHRLAWIHEHGAIETQDKEGRKLVIDHINGNRKDNRIANLRLVTHRVNSRNQSWCRGQRNVFFDKARKRWTGQIQTIDGVVMTIGSYKTKRDALFVYNKIRPLFTDV